MHWIYDLASGRFTGAMFDMSPPVLARMREHVPEGCAVWPGPLDWERQRVGEAGLEDCTPLRPADTSVCTWSWDEAEKRWAPSPTLLALKQDRSAPILAALAAEDAKIIRPTEELTHALLTGSEPPAEAAARFAAILAAKLALREQLAAIQAATE